MSIDQPPLFPEPTGPPPRPGMGTGTKVLLILLVVFGLLLLLCCGGLMLSGYYFASYMQKAASDDPATVVATTEKITHIDIPAGLKPAFSLNMKVPFSERTLMIWAMYADKASDSTLVLAAMGEAMGSQNQTQMRQAISQSLQQQGLGEEENLTNQQQYTKQVEIRGQMTSFFITKGEGAKSHRPRIQVTGSFQGATGPAMLIFNGDAAKFPEAEVTKMLESIK
jgi:hypothetical protein